MPAGKPLFGRGASLRTRLIGLSVAALLPGFCVIGFVQYQVSQSRQAEVHELAIRNAQQAGLEIERLLLGVQALLVAVSQAPVVRGEDFTACSSYLAGLAASLPNLTGISVLGPSGNVRCASVSGRSTDLNYADRQYFSDALASSRLVTGTYTVGRASTRAVLPIALAVRDRVGNATGVLVAAIDLAWLGEQLKQRGLSPGGSLTVADRTGTIIAREPLPERFVSSKIPAPYDRLLTAAVPGSETLTSQDGTRRVLGYVPLSSGPQGLYVSVGLSEEESFGAVARAARIGALLTVSGALATLALTWLVGSHVFIMPLRRLEGVLEQWREGNRFVRTGFRNDTGEIGALGEALDRLMDEISESEDHRLLLTNELAHRVKNTLSNVMAIAASTLNKPQPARELLPEFQSRITALSHTHEILTRDRWEVADLRTLARAVLSPLCDDVDVRFQISGPEVELPARDALGMTMVLHELCTNAIKYGALSQVQGRVRLQWSVVRQASSDALQVTWTERGGPPVQAPPQARGFGTRMIPRAFGHSATTTLDFYPDGLLCRVQLSLTDTNASETVG